MIVDKQYIEWCDVKPFKLNRILTAPILVQLHSKLVDTAKNPDCVYSDVNSQISISSYDS